jgi:epsin
LIHCGSDQALFIQKIIFTLLNVEFLQYVDDSGRDQGANVRNKVKDVLALLNDEQRLRDERGTLVLHYST